MVSARAKCSNYVHSHISVSQGVNTTPLGAGTQGMVLGHQMWILRGQLLVLIYARSAKRGPRNDFFFLDDQEIIC